MTSIVTAERSEVNAGGRCWVLGLQGSGFGSKSKSKAKSVFGIRCSVLGSECAPVLPPGKRTDPHRRHAVRPVGRDVPERRGASSWPAHVNPFGDTRAAE